MQLSRHFTLEQMCENSIAKSLGIDNMPDMVAMDNLQCLCNNVLEPLAERGIKVVVMSGFRSKELNKVVGGDDCSPHMKGEAVDIIGENWKEMAYPDQLKTLIIWAHYLITYARFDNLALVTNGRQWWMHISCVKLFGDNRNLVSVTMK